MTFMKTTNNCTFIKMKHIIPQRHIPVKASDYLILILQPKRTFGSQPESTSYCLFDGICAAINTYPSSVITPLD